MDLMRLMAKIELDDSSYQKGIDGAEKAGEGLASKMSSMTVAVGNIAADMIKKGVSAISGVISNAVDGYANYEQLVGGVETLFKGSADKVAKYAKQSFKTTGLSANDYMETVTSFSASLLQGLHGNTDEAADVANLAITDMADNANKMGTDIKSIQAAYQGFAKQNYTMLDNLKLGYGGTQSEMIRLINDSGVLEDKIESLDGITFDQMILAIHAVQSEIGITGTTAQEAADTISGSENSLKAAWQDLLVAVTGTDSATAGTGDDPLTKSLENFKTSFTTYVEQIVPTIVQGIANSGTLVSGIADAIASLPETLLSDVGDAAVEGGTGVVNGVTKIVHWLISSITNMFENASANPEQLTDLGQAIGNFIGTAVKDIVTNAPALLKGAIDIGIALTGGLIEGLFQGLFGEKSEVDKVTDGLKDSITDIDMNNAKASGILDYMDQLAEKFGAAAKETKEWQEAENELKKVMPEAGEVFQRYGSDIQDAIDKLKEFNEESRKTAIRKGAEKALADIKELYGEQAFVAENSREKANIVRAEAGGIMESARESLKAYAEEYIRQNPDDQFSGMFETASSILNGETDVSKMSDTDLFTFINQFATMLRDEEGNKWDESLTDKIFSPEEMANLIKNYGKMMDEADELEKTAAEAQKEADETLKEWQRMQAVVNRLVDEQKDTWHTSKKYIEDGSIDVSDALDKLARRIVGIQIKNGVAYMPEATGIEEVPFNGFRAELHRGESVLTAREAEAYRNGNNNVNFNEMEERIIAAIKAGMQDASVNSYLDGQLITDSVSRNLATQLADRRFV